MIKIYKEVKQNSEEWLKLKCGTISASNVKFLLTPTLKASNNDKTRAYIYELLAQRITNYIEPIWETKDMERGHIDEIYARNLYSKEYAKVEEVGFITNDKWGFTLGYSPDGLVGDEGLIEIKSRRQKFQIQTILDFAAPDEFVLQLQTALLVSERKWIDFISYSGGLPMFVKRVYPDQKIQDAIVGVVFAAERNIKDLLAVYNKNKEGFFNTERIVDDIVYMEENGDEI